MKMKKILTLLMACMFVLGMSIPAFAAGSIEILEPGSHSYTAYKIFDAAAGSGDTVVYTLAANSPWADVVMNSNGSSKVEGLEFRPDASPATKYTVVKQDGFSAADFAALLKAGIPSGTTAITFSGDPLKAAIADDGYYLVVPDTGDVASLTTVLGNNVTVQNKNDMPFEKTVKEASKTDYVKENGVELGDTLNFKLEGKVPADIAEHTEYVYLVKDKMDEGLTFIKPVTVTIGGNAVTLTEVTNPSTALLGNQIRYNANDETFELSLNLVGKTADAPILITYNATVNEAAAGMVSENIANLSYGHDPRSLTNKDSMTKSYTSKIVIDKFETGHPEQKLADAKFVLKNSDGKFYKWDNTNKAVEWVNAQGDATEVVTDSEGRAEFNGLSDGTYTLVETAAPKDYAKAADTQVIIDGSGSTAVGLTATQIALALVKTVNIANTPGTTLPSTGGMGTTILYLAGALIMAAAAVMMLRKKKNEE